MELEVYPQKRLLCVCQAGEIWYIAMTKFIIIIMPHNVMGQLKKLKMKAFLIFSWIYLHHLNECLA